MWQRQFEESTANAGARGGGPSGGGFDPFPALSAAQAANPYASHARRAPVEEGRARGVGTFTAEPVDRQVVKGRGVWDRGRWYVTFARERAADGGSLGSSKIAFALWDGARGERGGRKAVSGWYPFAFGGP